jgi:ADP-ribose pyrophosphatase YjhB (NUDIX family)
MSGIYETATPYLDCCVLLRDGNKIACVLRANTKWMNGFYGLPAGKVEQNETFSDAAVREAKEEVGVTIKPENLRHVLTVQRHANDSDWVDVIFEADKWEGEVINAEPEMHSAVEWLDIDALPENIIPVLRFALEQIKAGKTYAEYGW